MDEKNDWRGLAVECQLQYFETLGSRPYDEIEKCNLFLLKKKVGFATCGKPSELPNLSNYNTGYKKEEIEHIKPICNKIIEKSDYDPVRFSCTILLLNHQNAVCETPVFRIVNESGNIFIDAHTRVYQNWESFMRNNTLPECEYCFPLNGEYYNEKQSINVGFAKSPACNVSSKVAGCFDTAGSVASVAAASVFAASAVVTVGPAAMAAAGATAVCSGAYNATRSIGSLIDRNNHEQPIGLSDKEARSSWFSLGSAAIGTVTMGALGQAQKLVESGKSLSKLGLFGLHALTATSVVFSGFGFVDTFILCTDKYKKGTLTNKDVFDLSCELLFLFNAIASAHATTKLVNNMSAAVGEIPSSERKLTKTQKRNLRKRAAKRRAKGMSPYVTEESNNRNCQLSTTLQLIIFEAVRAYAPRVEEVLYTCQSIGHDIMSWKTDEITDFVLMSNLARSLTQLYNNYKDEVAVAIEKVMKYFRSLSFEKLWNDICKWFENSTNEIKSIFCTKIINMEDQMENLVNDAEREIAELHERLEIENVNDSLESNSDYIDNFDDSDFNSETQTLLTTCGNVITTSSLPCNDLEEFSDIIDSVKFVVIDEFSSMMSFYKKSLEAAKAASGSSFDIGEFNRKLGITGDVGQHMINETLKTATAGRALYKIKSKCKELSKDRNVRTTPVWEVCTGRSMFHYFGPLGAGDLPLCELLPLVGSVMKISLIENDNCKVMQNKDVVIIEVDDEKESKIVVYCGITEDNTASGVIMIINSH